MTTDRCPACNAAVPAGAEWCTLCYAVLRVPETVPAAAAPVHAEPAPAPAATLPAALPAVLPPDPILDAPVVQTAPVAGTKSEGWPCLSCGALVPLADNVCPQCFQPFLPKDDVPSLSLPVVGNVGRMDRGQRLVVFGVLSLMAMSVLIVLGYMFGSVL